jgi:hypothetical protein
LKTLFLLLSSLLVVTAALAGPPTLTPLKCKVIADQTTFTRPQSDHRCCVWTDDSTQIKPFLAQFKLNAGSAPLPEGKILAAFFNDHITETFTEIMRNEAANEVFADYADSGIMFKLAAPPAGSKYSHLTIVVFDSPMTPHSIGIRGMVRGAASQKFSDAKE